jgi:hypothetical protein
MVEEIGNQSRIKNHRMKNEDKKSKNDVEFDEIVRFLNAQKAVLDCVGLN